MNCPVCGKIANLKTTVRTATTAAGIGAGGYLASTGASTGAAIGTALCPGVGTLAGSILGILLGAAGRRCCRSRSRQVRRRGDYQDLPLRLLRLLMEGCVMEPRCPYCHSGSDEIIPWCDGYLCTVCGAEF